MTERIYLKDMTLLSTAARIKELIPGEKPVVRLDRTIFHPQGGGQKADRGTLGSANVVQVFSSGEEIDHLVDSLEGLVVGGSILAQVDPDHRYVNSIFHSCTHLVVSVIEAMHPELRVTSGHSWPGEARVEFSAEQMTEEMNADAINARLRADIADNLPVTMVARGSEPRAFAMGNYAPIACGGTHIQSLAEVQTCRVVSIKRKNDRVRVSFDCTPV